MPQKLSKTAMAALNAVTGRRSRFVVDHILKYGSVTTAQIETKCGQAHAARAPQDVRDQGIPLVTTMIRKNGRRMAQYTFGDLDNITIGRAGGRRKFPKVFKAALVAEYGSRCCPCNTPFAARYLQIDHRIPYAVAGDGISAKLDVKDYMLVCGSCNRAKSWSCEHCPNELVDKDPRVCATCYWGSPLEYSHVATLPIRRLDLTWTGDEVADFDAAKAQAGAQVGAMPKFVKEAVRRAIRGKVSGTGPQT